MYLFVKQYHLNISPLYNAEAKGITIQYTQRVYIYIASLCNTNILARIRCKYTKFFSITYIYAIFFLLTCINFDSII